MTQGKIEHYHRSMKNILLLEKYYSSDELMYQIGLFVNHHNNPNHEALNNLTPADVYYSKGREILTSCERTKENTMLQGKKFICSLKAA